ncbi:MAG: hypothetical protein GPJ54_01230 [Candidatus Heimdallarchaeota archaeon]|nr:hypothetical protein [Candidatus Heimdallarchaeota archaeon]
MVDPVSLAVISGASMVSMIIGRFSKNSTNEYEAPDIETNGKLQFINLKGPVDPQQFLPEIQKGKSIFINIRALITSPEDLSEFLYNLEITAKRYNLALKQISSQLLLLTTREQLLRSKTISQAVNRDSTSKTISKQNIEIMAG